MPDLILCLFEAIGIQKYIYSSNILRENIAASDLVRLATRVWPHEIARGIGRSNVKKDDELSGRVADLNDAQFEDLNLDIEVLHSWGGSFAVICANPTIADEYCKRLSRKVLEVAPGLELAAVRVAFQWDKDKPKNSNALAEKIMDARNQMAFEKRNRPLESPLLGLGPTVACQSTGLPASGTDADEPNLKPPEAAPRSISAEIMAKLRHLKAANDHLESVLPQFKRAGLDIPYDFDNLGRERGQMSYIAVVHTDGNNMGKKIDELRSQYCRPEDNRSYIRAMRRFTSDIDKASDAALQKLSDVLSDHRSHDSIVGKLRNNKGEVIELNERPVQMAENNDGYYIPFRPIAYGGDDFTFVSDGRLGLSLAAEYLDAFEREMRKRNNEHLKDAVACAGIAIVKTHYPFSRAYDLAVELCRSAKKEWERQHSALDWHFAATGLFGDLDEIRERHYRIDDNRWLNMRPITLSLAAGGWRTWLAFTGVVETLTTDAKWRDKRNKVLALQETLRRESDAVELFRRRYKIDMLPVLAPGYDDLREDGWHRPAPPGAGGKREPDRCGYFDAIEALDFYLPLKG